MAIGDNSSSNQNNNKKDYSKEYYSQYTMSNTEGVESSRLSYSIWGKKLLKITISPQKKVNDDSVAFDYENNISIYLTHTKALILLHMLELWEKRGCTGNVGINSGNGGLLTVSDGSEHETTSPCITISALDNNGNFVSDYCYTARSNYHYGIDNFNRETKQYETEFFNNLEIEQLKIMLKSYVEASTTCIAATVAEELSYPIRNIQSVANAIAEEIGAKVKAGGSGKAYSKNTFFGPGGTNTSSEESKPVRTGSIDDLDDGM